MDKPSSNRSVYSVFELLNIPTPEWSSAVVLIVVAILFVLAFVYKQATQPVWQPSQELSEKIRLYTAGSMAGDFTKKMFNTWTTSQEDPATSSNDDEKSERHPLDMPSSSSTSLSLPTHNVSPRLYKKASNSQLRRQSIRLKQGQIPNVNTRPLTGSYLSPSSSSNCSSDEHSPLPVDREESKTTFTINVSEPLNARNEQNIGLETQENSEPQSVIPVKASDYNDDTTQSAKPLHNYSLSESNLLDSMKNASPNLEGKSLLSSSSNLSKERNDVSEKFNFAFSLNSRSDPMVALPHQESDAEVESIISDDHSEHTLTNSGSISATLEQKSAQEEPNQTARPGRTNSRKRRRRTRGKNNGKQNNQREQVSQTEQRPIKQEQTMHTVKQDIITQQHPAESSRSRHVGEPARPMSFASWQKALRPQQIQPQTYHNQAPQTQLLNNSGLFHSNKRNLPSYNQHHSGNTAVSAINKKSSNYQRLATLWRPDVPAASHVSLSRSNTIPTSAMRNSITRFSYADVTAPNSGRSSTFSSSSQLSNSANITTPAPAASGINEDTANNQWYSPFSSGFSIQLTPPASPRIGNSQISDGSVGNSSTFSLFSAGSPAPISTSTNNSSSDLPSSASFSTSLFGRKIPMSEDDNRFT